MRYMLAPPSNKSIETSRFSFQNRWEFRVSQPCCQAVRSACWNRILWWRRVRGKLSNEFWTKGTKLVRCRAFSSTAWRQKNLWYSTRISFQIFNKPLINWWVDLALQWRLDKRMSCKVSSSCAVLTIPQWVERGAKRTLCEVCSELMRQRMHCTVPILTRKGFLSANFSLFYFQKSS